MYRLWVECPCKRLEWEWDSETCDEKNPSQKWKTIQNAWNRLPTSPRTLLVNFSYELGPIWGQ